MPVIDSSNNAVNTEFQYVGENQQHTICATGLTGVQTVDIHVRNAVSSELLYVKDEPVQITATNMTAYIQGPGEYKIVKAGGVTAHIKQWRGCSAD